MAKRFIFRFDTMLKIRRQREDEHKRVVAERLRQIQQVRDQKMSLERQIHEETDAIRIGQSSGAVDIQQIMRHRHWLGHLHKGVLEADAALRFHEAKLAQERVSLTQAVKDRRILEKLRQHQWEQFQHELERREMRDSDELATMRYAFAANEQIALSGL